MIGILCRSAYLSSFVASASRMDAAILPESLVSADSVSAKRWLLSALKEMSLSVVFYEPSFFVDPACFRAVSPSTRFVVLSGPGDETTVRKALASGAVAMLEKPVRERDVDGVLRLVSC